MKPPDYRSGNLKQCLIFLHYIEIIIYMESEIIDDLIGQFTAFTPKFVKKYANVADVITEAMRHYVRDVKEAVFPTDEHCYHMLDGEAEKLVDVFKQY